MKRILSTSLAGLALALALACGGGSTSSATPGTTTPTLTPAASLSYADPSGSGWRLVKDASSTPTRLVLNLVGPSGARARGVGFTLQAPDTVAFDVFPEGLPLHDLGVFELQSTTPNPTDPYALVGGVLPGNRLSVGVFQKDRALAAKDCGAPLLQIALTLGTPKPSAGETLSLALRKAKVIPEDIGSANDDLYTLSQKLRMADISVAVGTLTAK